MLMYLTQYQGNTTLLCTIRQTTSKQNKKQFPFKIFNEAPNTNKSINTRTIKKTQFPLQFKRKSLTHVSVISA